MEQIKRENRLYTNDSIFLKKSLSIPVMAELDACMATSVEGGRSAQGNELLQEDGRDITELTPNDFLKRLDGLISQSKHAAVKGCQDAEKSRGTSFRRSQSAILASEQNEAVTVPQTITRLTRKMREREDEIFEL
ncbi:hypothetical protein NL108_013642 [Boleophthalmus pectinirostris]|nr:hypothetical protein NL108_013642 [Boleophthalmus pectinirostris]